MHDIRLILDNIRSTHNVGSIFRTADAAGVTKLYLLGTTPSPIDRFGRKRNDMAKVSLGAEDTVTWEYVEDVGSTQLVKGLKKGGFIIVALEQDDKAVDYKTFSLSLKKKDTKVALILGNEVGGVSKKLLKVADIIAEIPMRGEKESLNVSVAAGVALFQLVSMSE